MKAQAGRYEVLATSIVGRAGDGLIHTYFRGDVIELTAPQAEKLLSRNSVKVHEVSRRSAKKAETDESKSDEE